MPITKTLDFLPAVFQSETNSKFLGATLDQLVTEPNVATINGYVGRKFTPGWEGITSYIREPNKERADYQLEPTVVVKNPNNNEVEYHGTYPDLLAKLNYFGGNTVNQDRLFHSESYNFNPRINLDEFVNFGKYYWLPNGPASVNVYSGIASLEKTYYIYPNSAVGEYTVSGYANVGNPSIVLVRGGNYEFVVNQAGKKFYIQTEPGINVSADKRTVLGVSNNGEDTGTVTFAVPLATAQDVYVDMPKIQDVSFVADIKFSEIDGQLLSQVADFGGLDGVSANTLIDGKSLIFSTDSTVDADWTSSNYPASVPSISRWKVWNIVLTPSGGDYIVTLYEGAIIPSDNKITITTGLTHADTEWYKNTSGYFTQIDPITAPLNTLYYQDSEVDSEYGIIRLIENTDNAIDVDVDIVGKKQYISPTGVIFTNGLKVKFDDKVIPTTYRNVEYYVEGVGTSITLIKASDLSVSAYVSRANFDPTLGFSGTTESAELTDSKNTLTITTTVDPTVNDIGYGEFPNASNQNFISTQDLTFDFPYRGGLNQEGNNTSNLLRQGTVGLGLAGIPFYSPYSGQYIPGTAGTTFHYNTAEVLINGEDSFGGLPDSNDVYHYHSSKFITANAWGNVNGFTTGYTNIDGHSKLIGFAADGYPIYGPYGYSNPGDSSSGIDLLSSGYVATASALGRPESRDVTITANTLAGSTLTVSSTFGINPGMRLTFSSDLGIDTSGTYWVVASGDSTATGVPSFDAGSNQIRLNADINIYANTTVRFDFLPGAFIEDYVYTGIGALDEHNGRYCVTPEFPQGTYAYFSTQDSTGTPVYPYFVGTTFYGSLDPDDSSSLQTPDYLVINRASKDQNPWSRRNRWFHERVLQATNLYNNTTLAQDTYQRATRPIIDFIPDLQLYDFGVTAIPPVDIFDTTHANPFVSVEGVTGIFVDGVNLISGMRIIFAAASDPAIAKNVYRVSYEDTDGEESTDKVVHLTLEETATLNDTVAVLNGKLNVGKNYWYTGAVWDEGQSKLAINQSPLFDIYDAEGYSLSDISKYPVSSSATSFKGTKLFGYKEGTGADDSILGFPLSYKTIGTQGDIEFTNNYDTDIFSYKASNKDLIKNINVGFLRKNTSTGYEQLNVWDAIDEETKQYQVIGYDYDGLYNDFRIDVIPESDTTTKNLQVYVNFKKIKDTDYQIITLPQNYRSISIRPQLIKADDRIDILFYSKQVSAIGNYQIPDSLNLNAQNTVLSTTTLGEVRKHLGTMTRTSTTFSGEYPGNSNIRDIVITGQPGSILQQSSPATYASMFLGNDTYSIVAAVYNAQQEYTRFKNKFLTLASRSNQIDIANPRTATDLLIKQINYVKNNTFPWHFSDMVPYGDNKNTITYNVFDPAQTAYEITTTFALTDTPSNNAILVYLNNRQLAHGSDYTFSSVSPAISLTSSVNPQVGDSLVIYEYRNTDGCYIPETPSKLGLYPKVTPVIITDTTYSSGPVQFILGHDGSKTLAFGDFRDQLLLELETRIYNNIKVTYDEKTLSIFDSKPSKFRDTGYTFAEYNRVLAESFLKWIGFNKLNFISNSTFNIEDAFTWNYTFALDKDGEQLQGSWRSCYEYFYDTQHPHTHPWEMLGFLEQPTWWQERYGPAPYTSGNEILWNDLEAGYIASGDRQGYDLRFARPGLSDIIPVNEYGELQPPVSVLASKYDSTQFDSSWRTGQWSPVETAWRNTSEWPFAQQIVMAITHPGKYFGLGINTTSYKFNTSVNQYLDLATNYRITPTDVKINGRLDDSGNVQRSTGYINWINDLQVSNGKLTSDDLYHYLTEYTVQLAYRMAGFSDKTFLKVLAEQYSPSSINESVIIPDQDFDLILGKSSPVRKIRYSAVILKKTGTGFEISGYDTLNPSFTIVAPNTAGQVELVSTLNDTVQYYKTFNRSTLVIPYGTVFRTIQQVSNFLAGYEQYLKLQGFTFSDFDEQLGQIKDWTLSTKEFLFWKQQNWADNSSIVLSPFASKGRVAVQNAFVDGIQNSVFGTKVVNQNFNILGNDAYSVTRSPGNFSITLDDTTSLIGYLSLDLVQYEHILIFNNKTQFNDVIYAPETGERQYRLKLIGQKTAGWDGSLSPQGFIYNDELVPSWKESTDYLKGDLIEYKNFYYSAKTNITGATEFVFDKWLPVSKEKIKTGLLNNFATQAGMGKDFYDINSVNVESQADLLGFGLIGFRPREYFYNAGIDDTTQVQFYQGYIKQKGTLNAINALGAVSFNDEANSIDIGEYWAFRVGEYGSLTTNQFVELILDEDYTLNNPTSLLINGNNSVTYSSLYTTNQGLLNSERVPFVSPFLLNRTDNSIQTDDIQTAGFVNIEDVDYTIFDLSDTSTFSGDIKTLGVGETIWTANNYNKDWDVYRITGSQCAATEIVNALDNKITINTNVDHLLAVGDTIVLNSTGTTGLDNTTFVTSDYFVGFYKVLSVNSAFSFTVQFTGDLTGFSRLIVLAPIYKMQSMRNDRATEILDFTPVGGWNVDSKVWVNYETDTTWGVYNKTEPWSANLVLNRGRVYTDGNFGAALKISTDSNFLLVGRPGESQVVNYQKNEENALVEGRTVNVRTMDTIDFGSVIDSAENIIAVGAPLSGPSGQGHVQIFIRDFTGEITPTQIFSAPDMGVTSFGSSISMSRDHQWLYIGAPESDVVYAYEWRTGITEETETISVNTSNVAIFSLAFTPNSPELVTVSNSSVDFVPYVDFTITGNTLTFTSNAQPDTYIVRQKSDGYVYRTPRKLEGNVGSGFGSSISCSTDGAQVVIGAPLAIVDGKENAGALRIYDRTVEKFIATEGQTIFGTQRDNPRKVFIGNELQVIGIDYTVPFTNQVQFAVAPATGSIVTIETNAFNLMQEIVATDPIAGAQFGYSVDLCNYNCSIYAGSPYYSSNQAQGKYYTGAVYRNLNQGRIYGTIVGNIQNPVVVGGDSIRLNDFEVVFNDTTLDSVVNKINQSNLPGITASNYNGYLKIDSDSTIIADKLRVLTGLGTALTDLGLTVFEQTQIIENPTNFANDLYGQRVKIDADSDKLLVSSDVATTVMDTTFDLATKETTYDANSTEFVDEVKSGAVWVHSLLSDSRNTIENPGKFVYVQQLAPNNITVPGLRFSADMKFGSAVDIQNGRIFVGAKDSNVVSDRSGIVIEYINPNRLLGWDLLRAETPKVDINGIIKAYTYSENTQTILDNLDYIDPAKGKILGLAEQDITFKVDYDPAVYNNGNSDSVSIDSLYFWNTTQVGQVWWDLSTVKYIDYEQGSIKYRTTNWGRPFPNSSIDVYEWVESNYPPSRYVSNGGDGEPKYANDDAYVTLSNVDAKTNQTIVKYYFWVKNKTNVGVNTFGRTIPTITIAEYIRNPKATGVKYFAAVRDDAFAVYNLEKDVVGTDTVFHVDYATEINSNIIHSEYALISESPTSYAEVPEKIYNKMIDSLSMIDSFGNSVPDPALPAQTRYGIGIRPRQGVFIDSNLALKELVTYVNSVFAKTAISQGYDLSSMESGQPAPGPQSNEWDREVPTFELLTFINVVITLPGYRVLVHNDETVSNLWTIYTLQENKTWMLTSVQTYRPTDYWEYIDWYATGISADTVPKYTVSTLASMATLSQLRSGDIVKVLNNGQNKWVLLQVFANTVTTIGLESGTIRLLDSLWDLEEYGMSFDNDLFDTTGFDRNPSIEIRKILETLQTDIFVNELKPNFVEMFFTLVYYVLSEQKSVDWVFKTSLIDAIQKIDGLTQPQIFAKDNQDIYKDYIDEVKPYHTTIREYITDYLGKENWTGYTTDFDVPTYYDTILQQYRSPSGEFAQDALALQKVEYRDWLLNYPYSITEIEVISGGTGYTSAPTVTITGSTLNNNAVGIAKITNGRVTKISLLYPGTNYITQPIIEITGGNGTGAKAYAKLSGNPIRKIKTTLVYDRLTYGSDVMAWEANTSYSQGDIIAYAGTAYQALRDFESASTFVGNDLTLYTADNFNNANDRIQSYYSPEVGSPGKSFGLLQHGIEYPSVTVSGPLFADAGGFDVGTFDISAFDALEIDNDGTYIISDSILDSKIESLYTDSSLGTKPEDIIIDGDNYLSKQVLDWNPSTYYPQGTVLKNNSSYYITNVGVTTGSTFSTTDLMDYPLNPYTAFASHAPEELVPGRVYDTLDITVSTFDFDCDTSTYSDWIATTGFRVEEIVISDGGLGYDSNVANISVTITGTTGSDATASVTSVDENGTITVISVVVAGTAYSTIPDVIITGSNIRPATAGAVLSAQDYLGSPVTSFDYRIFKDMNDNYSYTRVSPAAETTLAENVSITSNTIVVTDASVLSNPAPYGTVPGVVYINGERITYWAKDDSTNTLSNIRRGTLGTGTANHAAGSVVYDGSFAQRVPESDHYTATNLSGLVVTTAGEGYEYDPELTYIRSNLWYDQGFAPDTLFAEPVIPNVTANLLVTETIVALTTEGGVNSTPSQTTGEGLFNSTSIQVLFVKDEI